MSTESPEPEVPEPPDTERQQRDEKVWLSAGALIGMIVAGLAVAVVVLAGNRDGGGTTAGASPASSSADPGAAVAAARDESLRAAEEAVIVLNSLDHRNTADGLSKWESVASVPLLDELKANRAAAAGNAEKSKTTTTAKLLAAAVSKLAPDNSSAEILASVEVTTTDAKGAPTVKQSRQKLTMTHTGHGWKVSTFAGVEPPG